MPDTILIVDDEPHMLRLTEMSLRKGGYQLVLGRNGREAVTLAHQHRPALIVMDVQMPELDGLEALRELRQSPATAHIPVIMLTVRGHAVTRQEAEASGASLFLTKPYGPSQLLAAARKLIAPNPPAPSLPPSPTPTPPITDGPQKCGPLAP